jgi:CheY-like chemotaxis protein
MARTPTALAWSQHAARILVVDDDDEARDSLVLLLRCEGYEAIAAENGREALAALRECGGEFSLILLDLMMPVMNGFEFRSAQRRDPRMASIPVVVLSATVDPAEEIQQLGAVAAFRKPVLDLSALLGVVAEHCSKKPG